MNTDQISEFLEGAKQVASEQAIPLEQAAHLLLLRIKTEQTRRASNFRQILLWQFSGLITPVEAARLRQRYQ